MGLQEDSTGKKHISDSYSNTKISLSYLFSIDEIVLYGDVCIESSIILLICIEVWKVHFSSNIISHVIVGVPCCFVQGQFFSVLV